ncbi:MAG: aspartate carbamoyltransferase regulatory subunit [Candidatus Altiarchaeales archaeon HGW-Altiarchaeales-3]|nr:MAG: aspartate carbamoyltransferase regulatory subunit [Candidatus Altiarchaeales archaeon HGW-Altiarchaeales-3]
MSLRVQKINNGTVIDHIKPGKAFNVLKILGIDSDYTETVTIMMNARSKKFKKKDIVKIENRYLEKKELDKISLLSPHAKVNIIKNSEVVGKHEVEIPDTISDVLLCTNPECISNHEKIKTKFYVVSRNPLTMQCHYCERLVTELKFK